MSIPSSGSSTDRRASITSSRVTPASLAAGLREAPARRQEQPDQPHDHGQDEEPLDDDDREPDRDRDDDQQREIDPFHGLNLPAEPAANPRLVAQQPDFLAPLAGEEVD